MKQMDLFRPPSGSLEEKPVVYGLLTERSHNFKPLLDNSKGLNSQVAVVVTHIYSSFIPHTYVLPYEKLDCFLPLRQ